MCMKNSARGFDRCTYLKLMSGVWSSGSKTPMGLTRQGRNFSTHVSQFGGHRTLKICSSSTQFGHFIGPRSGGLHGNLLSMEVGRNGGHKSGGLHGLHIHSSSREVG